MPQSKCSECYRTWSDRTSPWFACYPLGLGFSSNTLLSHVYVLKVIEFACPSLKYYTLGILFTWRCLLLKNSIKIHAPSWLDHQPLSWTQIRFVIALQSHLHKVKYSSRWIVWFGCEWFSFFPIWPHIHFIEVIKGRNLGDVSSGFRIKKASHKILLPTGMFH